MEAPSERKLLELQTIIKRMPLPVCCVIALPEMGVRWREVCRAVRNARLPMTPSSVARVLRRHLAKAMTEEEIEEIVTKLRLHLAVTQSRVWHLIKLLEPTEEASTNTTHGLAKRIARELSKSGTRKRPNVQTTNLDDYVYLSVQLLTDIKPGPILYVAIPLGQDVAFVSTLSMSKLIQACVKGFGYESYEDARLYGRDIRSLLRIYYRTWNECNADHLTDLPEYAPAPVITKNGIDYTHKAYDESYVNTVLGPSPPLLTDLKLETAKPFFDPSRLRKLIKIDFELKSSNIAETLKAWAVKRVIAPDSDFFLVFQKMKSNKISFNAVEDI